MSPFEVLDSYRAVTFGHRPGEVGECGPHLGRFQNLDIGSEREQLMGGDFRGLQWNLEIDPSVRPGRSGFVECFHSDLAIENVRQESHSGRTEPESDRKTVPRSFELL